MDWQFILSVSLTTGHAALISSGLGAICTPFSPASTSRWRRTSGSAA